MSKTALLYKNNHDYLGDWVRKTSATIMFRQFVILFVVLVHVHDLIASPDKFDEELFIKTLHSGHINTYFQFTTQWLLTDNESCKHFNRCGVISSSYFTHMFCCCFFKFTIRIWWLDRWLKSLQSMT